MDLPTLLHSLTTQGLRLSLGEAADSIAVLGPVASLTLEQQRALATHKQTLLNMLTLTCYFPPSGLADFEQRCQPRAYIIAYGRVACPYCLCSWLEETGATTVCWSCRKLVAKEDAIPTSTERYEKAVNQMIGGEAKPETSYNKVELPECW